MAVECNICHSREFRDMGIRKNILCSGCGSYERTRIMKLELDRYGLNKETSVLHIAPEYGLYKYIKEKTDNYVCADIDLERYSHISNIKYIDLCNPETVSGMGKFDLIIHSHVIEHIPCNYTMSLINLHNLLNRNGTHMFCVPIYGSHFEEDLGPISENEKTRRFGQFDHCRRFSPHDLERTLGKIFKIDQDYDLTTRFPEGELHKANIPQEYWKKYSGSSVFMIGKGDILI